jgi:hypothetical protein
MENVREDLLFPLPVNNEQNLIILKRYLSTANIFHLGIDPLVNKHDFLIEEYNINKIFLNQCNGGIKDKLTF